MGCHASVPSSPGSFSVARMALACGSGCGGGPAEVDVARLRSASGEEGAHSQLEETRLGSGKLGLADEARVQQALADAARHGRLFEDTDFPADAASLFFSSRSASETSAFTWRRPSEVCAEPRVFVDGTSRRDVLQGTLGDCWLLSTCAAIAKREDLIQRVIADDQPLFGPEYTGLVCVRLWRFGYWQNVYIDDRLPMRDGALCYGHCMSPNEFWVPLVEKALAKLHGSYEAIEGGMPIEAMVDLTGGLAERYELRDPHRRKTLYSYLRKSFACQAFITCSRRGDWRNANKAEKNGLVQGHAYTITGLYRVDVAGKGKVSLIRVRNPWGDKNEWTGAWSDIDPNWQLVSEEARHALGLHKICDGEFWMEFFADFCREFEEVSICTLGPDFNRDGLVDNSNAYQVVFGEWVVGQNAGGCRNNMSSFGINPQFLLSITEPDTDNNSDGDPNNNRSLCHVIIGLTQEHRRSHRDRKVKLLQIGFCVFRAGGKKRLEEADLAGGFEVGTSGPYINYREVFARFELPVGNYIIVPATFEPGCTSRFMIRAFANRTLSLRPL